MSQDAYEFIRSQLGTTVPFAAHAGVEVLSVGDGVASAQLAQTEFSVNHIGSQHAGALFTLAEAASGAAMIGALVDRVLDVRPLVRSAQIDYRRVARGTIPARATTSVAGAEIRAALDRDGRTDSVVEVTLSDSGATDVATVTVEWAISQRTAPATPAVA